MSYEEFVEGLRPETGADSDGSEDEAGFRLAPKNGIFCAICEMAQMRTQSNSPQHTLDGRDVWKMSLGDAKKEGWVFDTSIESGDAIFGFFPIDFSPERFSDKAAIAEAAQGWAEGERNVGFSVDQAVTMTHLFRNEMKAGDIVLVSKGNKLIRAIGEVTGGYRYEAPQGSTDYAHRRAVRWLWVDEDGQSATEFYDKTISQRTIYPLDSSLLNRPLVERLMSSDQDEIAQGEPEPHVLIIDEINRANISKVFGELITLLEPDKRLGQENEIRLTLPYSRKRFGVPSNLHIIGTMNTADRSIALLDTALRRRFRFRELMPRPDLLSKNVEGIDLQKLLARLNERIEYLFDREHQIGHAYFIGCQTRADVEAVMRDAVIPLLTEYFYEDWSKIWMVLEGSAVPESGDPSGRFLDGRRLVPPGFDDGTEDGVGRIRWSVRSTFDFSEFAPR